MHISLILRGWTFFFIKISQFCKNSSGKWSSISLCEPSISMSIDNIVKSIETYRRRILSSILFTYKLFYTGFCDTLELQFSILFLDLSIEIITPTFAYFIDSKKLDFFLLSQSTNFADKRQHYCQYCSRMNYFTIGFCDTLEFSILDLSIEIIRFRGNTFVGRCKNYRTKNNVTFFPFFQMNSFHSVPFSINFGRWYWQRQCFSTVTKNLEALCLARSNLSCVWHFSA